MTSHEKAEPSPQNLENLTKRLKAQAHMISEQYCPEMTAVLRARFDEIDALQQEINEGRAILAAGDPPAELVAALRSPAGPQRIVHITVDGRDVTVALQPNGFASPRREHAVWRQIRLVVQEAI